MPLLDIKGGSYNLQRFIYWNFIKCFWNSKMGIETSTYVNFDWYSPSNAKRFSREDIEADLPLLIFQQSVFTKKRLVILVALHSINSQKVSKKILEKSKICVE